jgi:acetyltransferase-like isoleucine patch superfamily enzyme
MKALIVFLSERVRVERILGWVYFPLYKYLFRKLGRHSTVSPFIHGVGLDCVSLGERSRISRNTRVLALKQYHGQPFTPEIAIGDNVSIGFGCTLSCVKRIQIGNDVTVGDNVYIADSHHDYKNIQFGVLDQPLIPGRVSIGDGAWIGYGAFLAGNVSVGEHAVVGANSVVTRPVPPYTIVAGVPARIIKRFDPETLQWRAAQA